MHRVLETFASRFAPGTPRPGNAVSIPSLTGASDAFLALALSGAGTAKPPRICVAVTPGLPDADRLSQDIRVVSAALPTQKNDFANQNLPRMPISNVRGSPTRHS